MEDAAQLTFEDSSFDLVVSQNVFHHVPDWGDAVREVNRILRPNGYLIWYDLTFPVLIVKLFRGVLTNYGLYTIEEVRAKFAKNGFLTSNEERVAHGPFSHYQIVMHKGVGSNQPSGMYSRGL